MSGDSNDNWFMREKDRIAAYLIVRFYRRWKKNKWNHRQANDAFSKVKKDVENLVGIDRSKDLLP